MTEIVTPYELIDDMKVKFVGKINDPAHDLGTKVLLDDGDTYQIEGRYVDSTNPANEIVIARLIEDENTP